MCHRKGRLSPKGIAQGFYSLVEGLGERDWQASLQAPVRPAAVCPDQARSCVPSVFFAPCEAFFRGDRPGTATSPALRRGNETAPGRRRDEDPSSRH